MLHGPGLLQENHRGHPAWTPGKVPGSGLGLSLVKAVADLHHAELRLEDADPGLRAVLRFRPVAGQDQPASRADAAANA